MDSAQIMQQTTIAINVKKLTCYKAHHTYKTAKIKYY